MSFFENYLFEFIFWLALTVVYIINFVHYMHMFQLNSYSAKEHFHWIKGNIGNICLRHFLPVLCSVYPFVLTAQRDPQACVRYGVGTAGALIMTGSVLLSLVFCRTKPAKKKLVFTPRVIRMCVTSGIIFLVFSYLFFPWNDYPIPWAILCLGQLTAPFLPMISNLINKPIEHGVNMHYINDAKRIISELPDTTVIGITGSYGKTSTKFYLEKLLSAKYNVLMTPASFNTTMGVVKTVRGSLNATHEIFLCEMGAKGVGEIKEICDIVHPKHSVITSIGEQHLETFGSLENIIKTKFEIADCITDGKVFLNYDNEYIRSHGTDKDRITYGISGTDTDYWADGISVSEKGTTFTAHHKDEQKQFRTKLLGEHNVQNILAAIAVSHELGISFDELVFPVKRLEAVPHRMEILDKGNGITIIDDAFNSNPAGARAALKTLSHFDALRIVITPGMVELGEREYQLNKELGMDASDCCDIAVLVGIHQAPPIKEGLLAKGFPENKIIVAKELKEALNAAYSIQPGKKRVILLENDLPDNY